MISSFSEHVPLLDSLAYSLTYTDCGCSTNAGSVSKPLCCSHSSGSDYVDSLSSFLSLSPSLRLNMLLSLRAMCTLVVVKVGVPTVSPVVFPWIFPFLSSNWKLEFSCFPSFFYPVYLYPCPGQRTQRTKRGNIQPQEPAIPSWVTWRPLAASTWYQGPSCPDESRRLLLIGVS